MADFMIRFLICNLFISVIVGVLLTAKYLLRNILSSRIQYRIFEISRHSRISKTLYLPSYSLNLRLQWAGYGSCLQNLLSLVHHDAGQTTPNQIYVITWIAALQTQRHTYRLSDDHCQNRLLVQSHNLVCTERNAKRQRSCLRYLCIKAAHRGLLYRLWKYLD